LQKMNEVPSFYPKHLAMQYVSSTQCSNRPKAEVRPLASPEKDPRSTKKDLFAPMITSSTVNLPSVKQNLIENRSVEQNKCSKALSGLPDSFADAMRSIYNLMDVRNDGRVRLEGKLLAVAYSVPIFKAERLFHRKLFRRIIFCLNKASIRSNYCFIK